MTFTLGYHPGRKKNEATVEGTHLAAISFFHRFHQLISEPTHLLPHSNSCIDLIFTYQPKLAVNCGTHASLNFKSHHQITYWEMKLKIYYPPSYEWLVWNYRKANIKSIKKLIEAVNWQTLFNKKAVTKQVSIASKTRINIFSNFVPNELVTFNGSSPPWINNFIKIKMK